jgi:hypothetical protein
LLTELESTRAAGDGTTSRELPPGGRRTSAVLLAARVGLGLQLAWLIGFSVVEFLHDDLAYDFAIFFQAGWKISHGELDPYSSIKGFPFWQNHGEAMMWLLAPFARIPPYGLWLLIAQDFATVAVGWVLVDWVAQLARSDRWISRIPPGIALGATAILFLANPWIYYATAFDFHLQIFAVLTLVLAARNLLEWRVGRAAVYVALTLAAGDVAGTYIAGLGVMVLLLGHGDRRLRKAGVLLVATGLAWTALLSALHANLGSELTVGYGYLAGPETHPTLGSIVWGAVAHPGRLLDQLGRKGVYLLATILPGCVLGIVSPFGAIPALTLLIDGAHTGTRFAQPNIFQSWPVWPFGIVGSLWSIGRLSHLGVGRIAPKALAAVVCLSSGYAAWAWFPGYSGYLAVSNRSAAQIHVDMAAIPARAEIVVCNGISGWFGDRSDVAVIMSNPFRVALSGQDVYFVLVPREGDKSLRDVEAELSTVRTELHARVLSHRDGVWLLRWKPALRQKWLVLQTHLPDYDIT